MRVVLDVDPGVDDALAMLLALRSPELEVVGIATVAGNVPVAQGTRNALAVLEQAGFPDVPVYQGAERPLCRRLTTATFFHGAGGLGNTNFPTPSAAPQAAKAVDFLCQVARQSEPVGLIALGPLTNLALACQRDPDWPRRVHRIVMMGGTVAAPGNVTPVAEANVYTDPEAAAIVLTSGAPITLVGLDVTSKATVSAADLERAVPASGHAAAGAVATVGRELMGYYLRMAEGLGHAQAALHDPLAVAVACRPRLVSTRRLRVEVETEGLLTRGETVAWLDERQERIAEKGDHDDVVGVEPAVGNVDVALEVDVAGFRALFLERLFGG